MNRDRLLRIGGPILLFVLLITAWETGVRVFQIQQMILPRPMQVVDALVAGFANGTFQKHLAVTGKEVLFGYLLGVTLGIAFGAAIALSRTTEVLLYPYLLALQTMPKIALAPLMMIWVGFGIESKILITMIVAIFPVLVNVIVGLRSVEPDRIALIRSLKGGTWAEFVWVRLPSAAPYIFAGMKTAVVLSLLGAIAAEFVGAEAGLGYLMSQLMFRLDTPGVFAILVLLGAIGVLLFLFADWLHRKIVFWDASANERWGK
ncbi:MAG TPA: ABC transporter permease [Burkholderiaceae bacterium]|nr:ABC transporter permease [Burkholderiaceae bacterium]